MSETKPLSNAEFIRVLMVLPGDAPVAERSAVGIDPRHDTSVLEKAHMFGWFRSQQSRGFGAYSRNAANVSARTTYNRLQSAAGLLRIGEAIGADAEIVSAAADEAKAETDYRRRCGINRRHLPWDTVIEPLARARLKGFSWGPTMHC